MLAEVMFEIFKSNLPSSWKLSSRKITFPPILALGALLTTILPTAFAQSVESSEISSLHISQDGEYIVLNWTPPADSSVSAYTLQTTPRLNDNIWVNALAELPLPETQISWSETNSLNQRFYRLLQVEHAEQGRLEEIISKTKNNYLFNKLINELYNLAKNDKTVSDEFTENIHNQIVQNELYKTLCDILIYIVLEKKQPVYIEVSQKEIVENILNNTNISVSELEKFLKLQMQDGINYTHALKKLTKEKNPYACYEMGDMEYTGKMVGYPRYIKSYEYFKIAAEKNHPRACWLIAQMFYQKKIGDLSADDLELAWYYLKKAEKAGSVAAINTIGTCYLNGLVPKQKKSETKAIEYFKKATEYEYVYAYNNLGKIYENKKEYKKAFKYFLFGAEKEESWACNKVGEYYRLGIICEKDMKQAFKYYNLATEVPLNILDHWAYFNLAKYFYLTGSADAGIEKNISKAVS